MQPREIYSRPQYVSNILEALFQIEISQKIAMRYLARMTAEVYHGNREKLSLPLRRRSDNET